MIKKHFGILILLSLFSSLHSFNGANRLKQAYDWIQSADNRIKFGVISIIPLTGILYGMSKLFRTSDEQLYAKAAMRYQELYGIYYQSLNTAAQRLDFNNESVIDEHIKNLTEKQLNSAFQVLNNKHISNTEINDLDWYSKELSKRARALDQQKTENALYIKKALELKKDIDQLLRLIQWSVKSYHAHTAYFEHAERINMTYNAYKQELDLAGFVLYDFANPYPESMLKTIDPSVFDAKKLKVIILEKGLIRHWRNPYYQYAYALGHELEAIRKISAQNSIYNYPDLRRQTEDIVVYLAGIMHAVMVDEQYQNDACNYKQDQDIQQLQEKLNQLQTQVQNLQTTLNNKPPVVVYARRP